MRDDNCIFCKIIAGEIPSKTIFEDDDFKVVLDVSPATKGHALILPKGHYADIYELPEEIASKIFVLAKKMAVHMTEKLNCDGFNIIQNNKEVAGQTVFHFHMHLIPRYQEDGNGEKICWNHRNFSEEEFLDIQQKLNGMQPSR
ncbi:MAG: HIT family protein [Eubacterium sp.]|jgi:Diadenosine tetraphosphate (Ap4A) hydrolase and other HIT family hydrolases|nr:HIT family protein [Eubacterium sp.]